MLARISSLSGDSSHRLAFNMLAVGCYGCKGLQEFGHPACKKVVRDREQVQFKYRISVCLYHCWSKGEYNVPFDNLGPPATRTCIWDQLWWKPQEDMVLVW